MAILVSNLVANGGGASRPTGVKTPIKPVVLPAMYTKNAFYKVTGPFFKSIVVVLAVTGGIVAAGCGNGPQADLAKGKELFTAKCGGCHVLADAGSKGVSGPDLDDAFRQARADGMKASTIEGVVLGQISNPSQRVAARLRMKPDIVTGDDARDVSAYIADVAGVPAREENAGAAAD